MTVLYNIVRETTVAQIRGHILIYLWASSERAPRSTSLRDEHAFNYKGLNLCTQILLESSVLSTVDYKIANVFIELDLLFPLTNWEAFTMARYCQLVQKRIDQY
jgi:hypothetical protein